jgi:5'-nucleotidase
MDTPVIVITNDDGVRSPGLYALYQAAQGLGEDVRIVAPSGPQSAAGMSITFFKPLRIERVKLEGPTAYAVSGSPTDCVFLAKYKLFKGKNIRLVLSGINLGENLTLQSFYTSGTVSAAMAAALNGINGIAFSMVMNYKDEPPLKAFEGAKKYAKMIVAAVLEKGFPRSVDVLSVNFPATIDDKTRIKVVPMARTMFDEYVVERHDPRGQKYYWLGGRLKQGFEEGTDVHTVMVENNVAVTPVVLSNHSDDAMRSTVELVNYMLRPQEARPWAQSQDD